MTRKTYRVYRQLSELYRDHDVYITPDGSLAFNDFVRISRMNEKGRKRSIYVWVRFIDDYYRTFYNSVSGCRFSCDELLMAQDIPGIVLCKHYRVRLDLPDDGLESVDLDITKVKNPYLRVRALYNAPDSLVRTTTVISVISLALGVIGLVLGVISLM